MLQRILYDSEGKTVITYLNFTDTTSKPVVLYGCESWGDPKEEINLSKIRRFYRSHFRQIVGVKKNACNSKMLVELNGVDTNNGSVEARCKLGLFYIVCTNMVYKTLVFLHRINNTEHNIKQNIYPGMEVICLIRPCQYRYFDTSSMILYIKRVTLKNDASNKMTNFQRDLFLKEHY